MSTSQRSESPVFACDLAVFDLAELKEHRDNVRSLAAALKDARLETPTRLVVELPNEAGLVRQALDFAMRERRCCSFFQFRLEIGELMGTHRLVVDVPEGGEGILSQAREEFAKGSLPT